MEQKTVSVFAFMMLSIGAGRATTSHSATAVGLVRQTSQPTDGRTAPKVSTIGHSVTLTWMASVPASKAPSDAVIGYIVYRSTKPHDPHPLPINGSRVTGTKYVDSNVEAGKTYYYVTRAVSANGNLSEPSNETEVKISSSASH